MAKKKIKTLEIVLYILLGMLTTLCFLLVGYRTWVKDYRRITTQVKVFEPRPSSRTNESREIAFLADNSHLLLVCSDDSSASAVAAVRSAVVHIKTTVLNKSIKRPSEQGGVSFDMASDGGTKNSIGSGVIFDPKGYILTNYHVIAGAEEVEVTPFGYKEMVYPARIVKADPESDLVILKIDSREKFPCATLGNSDLIEVADTVLAIGSPFGLEHTVTKGIISDNKRDLIIDETEYKDMIQTDAAINRGNSGGPLVNVGGEVIGINTAIYAPTGIFTGIGFAIPINKAKSLFREIYN